MQRYFLNNLELILSGIGLLITFMLIFVLLAEDEMRWQVATVVAVSVGVVHGLIFYVVRRQQRIVRQRVIEDIRAMLQDIIRNQLAVLHLNVQMSQPDERRLARINQCIEQITVALDLLSTESLHHWQQKNNHE